MRVLELAEAAENGADKVWFLAVCGRDTCNGRGASFELGVNGILKADAFLPRLHESEIIRSLDGLGLDNAAT
jgi:hypothetical protein